MDKEYVKKILQNNKYPSIDDLRYNSKIGVMLSKDQLAGFLATKDELVDSCDMFVNLPLKTFNSKYCFYVNSDYLSSLIEEYTSILDFDYQLNKSTFLTRNIKDFTISRLFSEIEGSLQIENVPTTQKRIREIQNKADVKDTNDIIVKNILNAMQYIVEEKPDFTPDNLLHLYNLLSDKCLAEDQKLREGQYYRYDVVYIDGFEGAPSDIVNDCMDSLFAFVSDKNNVKKYKFLLPYICHYYILYIHPYFDFNGRTARMVSFWLNYIFDIPEAPYFMSEAINENKNDYYRALRQTRIANNDLTYFLGYIFETSVKYSFVYKNLEEIINELSKKGDSLTSAETQYLKRILIHNPENYFNYKMFLQYIKSDMSKAGALKILNSLTGYNILIKSKNKKGEIIYRINPDYVMYIYHV